MKTESTFADALARHRALMKYFGAEMTPEDHQRGAMLEALHLLETEEPHEARDKLGAALKAHGADDPLGASMMRAFNWIEPLGDMEQAKHTLRQALVVASQQQTTDPKSK